MHEAVNHPAWHRSFWLLVNAAMMAIGFSLSPLVHAEAATEVPAAVNAASSPPTEGDDRQDLPEVFDYERAAASESYMTFLDVYDPWEGFNRRVYRFNYLADSYVIMPVVRGYRRVIPGFVRKRVSNFFSNLGDILVFGNSALQLKPKKTFGTLGRFAMNTTVGILGLFDPATSVGLVKYNEDFGQTLGHYGVGAGPYFVIPLLGPSSLRDATGTAVHFVARQNIDFLYTEDVWQGEIYVKAIDALNTRDQIPFQYGELATPFEYEMVRFMISNYRQVLVEN